MLGHMLAVLCLRVQWSQGDMWFHCVMSLILPKARGVSTGLCHFYPSVTMVLVVHLSA